VLKEAQRHAQARCCFCVGEGRSDMFVPQPSFVRAGAATQAREARPIVCVRAAFLAQQTAATCGWWKCSSTTTFAASTPSEVSPPRSAPPERPSYLRPARSSAAAPCAPKRDS